MRLIDADKLKPDCLTKDGKFAISQSQIANASTVEYTFEEAFQKTVCENRLYCPARPKGKWGEPFESNGKTYHKCSHCHISSELILVDNFCSNCGADMRGSQE